MEAVGERVSSERERVRLREKREERERLKRMARDISKQLTVVTHRGLREGHMMRYVPRPLCVIIIDISAKERED